MKLFLLIGWPYVRRHAWRYALLVAGVALGVAVAVAIQGGARSILGEFHDTVARMAGRCQLQVAAGEAGVPEAFLERLQQLPEIAVASPVIEALVELDDASRLLIVAVDMTGDGKIRPWLAAPGPRSTEVDPITFLAQPDSVLLSRSFAERRGWRVGSRFPLRSASGLRTLTVRGLLADDSVDRIYGGNLAVMDVYGAQNIFGRGRMVDRIDLVLSDGVPIDDARRAIAAVTGPGYAIEPPASRGQQFEDLLGAYRALQIMACVFAAALGVAMIDASFRLAVAQRRSEIGILRILGATSGQVQRLFLLEGLVTGLAGAVVGLGLGAAAFNALARALGGGFRNLFGGLANQIYSFDLTPSVALLALGAGAAISLLASWLPSREVAELQPVETLQPMHYEQRLRPARPALLVVSALLAAAALAGMLQRFSMALFYGSVGLLFLAVALAMPAIVLLVVGRLRPLVSRLFRLEGALAFDSLVRSPRRTSATSVVLVLVFALAVMVGGIRRSTRQTLADWVDAAFYSDLLMSASPNLASQSFRFPPDLAESLRALPGVADAQPVRSVRLPYRGRLVLALAADYEYAARKPAPPTLAGQWRSMCARTARGEAVFISETLASRDRLGLGDTLELETPRGRLRLPIAGVVRDYSDKSGVIFLDRGLYQRAWGDATADKLRIDAAPGVTPEGLRRRLRAFIGDRFPATILTREEARNHVLHPPGRRLSPVEIQLGISIVVAALALLNMAAISVAERTREFALIRSLGGLRRQLRKRLFIEILGTAAISLTLGLAIGAAMLQYALEAAERYVAGVALAYRFPWTVGLALAGVAALAGTLAVLASIPALGRIPLSTSLEAE